MESGVTWPFVECEKACVEVMQCGVGKGRVECCYKEVTEKVNRRTNRREERNVGIKEGREGGK